MVSRIVKVDPFDLVVFGGTGDLAYRKLYPALFRRFLDEQLTQPTRIFSVSRQPVETDVFRATVAKSLQDISGFERAQIDAAKDFLSMIEYVAVDGNGEAGWDDLKTQLGDDPDRVRAFYLATSPDLFGPIATRLSAHGLVTPQARIIVEKPLGKDGVSAARINDAIGAVFAEDRIYRIDHYLGKETVQNLMVLRFANALFEPLWNAAHIDHVQITVAESLGVEGRAAYYNTAGALRDMVQNHLLQLLCLIAMEPPSALDADAMRDEKLKVLRALRPIDEQNIASLTVRGQYRAGSAHGSAVPGYLDELGQHTSMTETFVALKAEVLNWRWAGVPFYLRTGKRLASRVSEIVVAFRPIPHSVFGASVGAIAANRLVLRLQPDEGVKLWLMIKDPGPGGMRLQHVPLDMTFAEAFHMRNPDAYERLLLDVVRGNQTLFMRRDEVEAAWRWIDPILDAWRNSGEAPKSYTAGTWGPSASIALIERDGRTWLEESN
ncbi:glucose-6-phosphate dehydrogenase [Beijerinckia indica]|uniref:Glucose-6-phosphate 1-dehydrogenase n=1 Tax=Beijerinckia indica subsp. indica (strain ATCC 9039 / DSM 1715 / NCIMB 8712) TaxID=395963 RepID=B2IKF6_BEII9|nr:glucose-6-phosphate dehydrogenase [Beijerinckia indica]ACB96436.1 glucose-6-phosphate 1-dehydrogenase [Beijerinckia indica subsp. indica ATCC 9039]